MEIDRYLERIGYKGNTRPTLELLALLQKKHLLSVPFENLDIHYKVPIVLNTRDIYEKVITKGRGGFCYELNSLFGELLKSLGFDVKMISARVFNQEKKIFSPEFDHLAVIAKIDSSDYLTDVGFGEFAFSPLKIELDRIQDDERGAFMIGQYDDLYYKVAKRVGKNWIPEYMFTFKARDLSEFEEMCHYNQTSPMSHFTQNKFCSVATENGRITVTANKIKITVGDTITELAVNSEKEFLEALDSYFRIRLSDSALLPNLTTL